MNNISFVTREKLLKSLTEKEADELIALIARKKIRLTNDDFLRESQLSKSKATGLTKQFEFYKADREVLNEIESQTEPVDIPTEDEEQVLNLIESKHVKARLQEKYHRIEIMMEKVRLVLEDHFREDLENVEKVCEELIGLRLPHLNSNHQGKSIVKVVR